MSDELSKVGIFIDDIYSLRVLDPKISNEANELKEECQEYNAEVLDFKNFSEQFITLADNFSKDVEQEKIRAVSTQNLLMTISKEREVEQQLYQSLILEKAMELDRLKIEYQYLQRIESEQQEIINHSMQNQ